MNVQHSISHARPLHDLDNGLDVGDDGSRRAIRPNLQPLIADLAGEALDVADDMRPGARQTDVRGIDAKTIDQVQDPQLFVDRGAPDGRRLQSIPERLVVQEDRPRPRRVSLVPVVDEPVHLLQRLGGIGPP